MGWDGMGDFWGPALDIWRGGQRVYLRGGGGGQMMNDPLTAQRIHPEACSYIPHPGNPFIPLLSKSYQY